MIRLRTLLSIAAGLLVPLVATSGAGAATTFSNTDPIQLVDKPANVTAPGVSQPYPSQINVGGMNGPITDVNVTLNDLTHSYLNDLAVVVEAPSHDALLLMSQVGPDPGIPSGVSAVDLTFDDEAAAGQLADGDVPASGGSFAPTGYRNPLYPFPSLTGYGNPGPEPAGTDDLSSEFDGELANGLWGLYVLDLATGDTGQIAGGWSVEIETTLGQSSDTTAPDTTITSGPADGATLTSGDAAFGFSASETPATFQCRMDGDPWGSCATPKSYSGLSEGSHTFRVRALDEVLNADATPAERSFTVDFPDPPPPPPTDGGGGGGAGGGAADTQPPTVTIGKIAVKKRTATATFSGSDESGGALSFSCKLDGKPAKPCTSPSKFKKLKPGKHKLTVTATDQAGNASAPATKGFKVKSARN